MDNLEQMAEAIIRSELRSRENVLDWLLAIAAVAATVAIFYTQLSGKKSAVTVTPQERADPNDKPNIYTINQPASRWVKGAFGPRAYYTPVNPSQGPSFSAPAVAKLIEAL